MLNTTHSSASLPHLIFYSLVGASSVLYGQTTVIIQSGSPVHVADYKNGDSVKIEASINTSDPTEGPEDEPLAIQSTTGFSATISPYNLTFTYNFTASAAGTLTAYIPGFDSDEVGTVRVTIGTVQKVQIVCGPLEACGSSTGNCPPYLILLDDIYHIRQRLGRHCYALITYNSGSQTTFAGYDINGSLASAQDSDPKSPPGGCAGGGPTGFGLASDCLDVLGTPTGDTILSDFQALVPNTEGTYNSISNNCNVWMNERIAGFGLNVTLPASAITSQASFCAQVPNIIASLQASGLPNFIINKIKAHYMPVSCP